MSVFDQHGQTVTYQYNAAGDINFDAVKGRADLTTELEKLRSELAQAEAGGAISEDAKVDAEYQLTKAIRETKRPQPVKDTLVGYLQAAKKLIEGVTATAGLATAIAKAVELAGKLF